MDLSKTPARLPEDARQEWKEWILDDTGCTSPTELSDVIADADEVSAKAGSIRTELSKFLNGHTHVVERWVGDSPTDKGRALAANLDMTPEGLRQRFLNLMPLPNRRRVDEESLRYVPIRVEPSDPPSILKPLEQWLRDRNRSEVLPELDGQESIQWSEFSDVLRRIEEALAKLESVPTVVLSANYSDPAWFDRAFSAEPKLTLQVGRRQLERCCDGSTVFTTESAEAGAEEAAVSLEIPFEPISADVLDQWVQKLRERGYVDADTAQRARQFFASVPPESIDKFSDGHLLYAVEDASEEPPESSPMYFRRRQISWLRRDLRETAVPVAQRWLRDTRKFFRRWIETTGAIHGDVTRDELDDILELAGSNDEEITKAQLRDELERCVLADDSQGFEALKQRLKRLLPESLKLALQESKLLEASSGTDLELASPLRRLGELELPLLLNPDDLETLDVSANSRLLADAVRLAAPKTLNDWCRAALEIEGIDQPWAMLAVLEGLAERSSSLQQVDANVLTSLWASSLWAILFRLNGYLDGSINSGQQRIAQKVSQHLRDDLPILSGENHVVDELKSYVDDRILEAVNRWKTTDSQTGIDKLGEQLTALAPFQIHFDEMQGLNSERVEVTWQLDDPAELDLHLAERGDVTARRAILDRAALDPFTYNKVEPAQLIEWWSERAATGSIDSELASFFESDFQRAFTTFVDEKSDDLRTRLRETLQNEQLQAMLPYDISDAVAAIESGPVATVEWLPQKGIPVVRTPQDDDPSRADILLALIELLEANQLLRDISEFDLSDLTEESRYWLYRGTCQQDGDNRPRLQFSRLRELAEFRHRSLLLLGKLGDTQPLRDSLDGLWQIEAPSIAKERARWKSLCNTVNPLSSGTEFDDLDDDLWRDTLEALCFGSLEEQRQELRQMTRWSFPDDERHHSTAYLLSLQSAPIGHRWTLLAPFVGDLWRQRDHESLRGIWTQLDSFAEGADTATWREPRELWQERRDWALQNDEETIRTWCAEQFDVSQLVDDLGDRAEATWPHLSNEQRERLLLELPEGPLDDIWWSRGQELPLQKRIQFARQHGTPKDRRRIAGHLLNAESANAESRLKTWLCTLRDNERPPIETVKPALSTFDKNLPDTRVDGEPLTDDQLKICYSLLIQKPTPERILEYLPAIAAARLRSAIDDQDDSDDESPEFDELVLRWTTLELRPVLRDEMPSNQRQDLKERLERLKNQAISYISSEPELNTLQLRAPVESAVDDLISEITPRTKQPNPKPIETLEEAKREIGSITRFELQRTVEHLSDEDATKLLTHCADTPTVYRDPAVVAKLILLIDESSMSTNEAEELTERVLDHTVVATDSTADDSPETADRKKLVAALGNTARFLRRTPLRRTLRHHAGRLLAADEQ